MKDLAPYIYPLIFAALVLLNYVIQRIARGQKQSPPADEEPAPPREKVQPRREEPKPRRAPLRHGDPVRPLTPPVAAMHVRRLSGVRAQIADRRSLRQAIVIMTVLGPCRAQQPHDVDR